MFFLIVLLSFQAIASGSVSNLDCSIYTSDKQIIRSLPFAVSINPISSGFPILNYARVINEGRVIELSLTAITSVPLPIFCLSSLRSLTLQYSTNLTIPPEISRLVYSLTNLNLLAISRALTLPEELFQLKNLQTLSIISSGLQTLPEEIEKLSRLSNLTLTGNRLVSLPTSLSKMQALHWLTVSSNPSLSSLDTLNGIRPLSELRASSCSIDHLPVNISNLKIIEMNDNKLTSLKGIDTYCSYDCQSFRFDSNRITEIPAVIAKVTSLNNFSMSNNLLTELPEAIYRIRDLKTLDLRNNNFDSKEIEWIQGRFRQTGTVVNI